MKPLKRRSRKQFWGEVLKVIVVEDAWKALEGGKGRVGEERWGGPRMYGGRRHYNQNMLYEKRIFF